MSTRYDIFNLHTRLMQYSRASLILSLVFLAYWDLPLLITIVNFCRYLLMIFCFMKGSWCFVGRRPRTRDVLQRHMYISEISQWLADAEKLEALLAVSLERSEGEARLI